MHRNKVIHLKHVILFANQSISVYFMCHNCLFLWTKISIEVAADYPSSQFYWISEVVTPGKNFEASHPADAVFGEYSIGSLIFLVQNYLYGFEYMCSACGTCSFRSVFSTKLLEVLSHFLKYKVSFGVLQSHADTYPFFVLKNMFI